MLDLSKTTLGSERIKDYEVEDGVILLNLDAVRWCVVTKEEYDFYNDLKKKGKTLIEDKDLENIAKKLLVRGIINYKSNDEKELEIEKNTLSVYFEPIPFCNLHCVYCYAGAELPSKIIYNTEETKKILDKVISYPKVRNIVFTGGEPLLRGDTLDLAEYVREKGKGAAILTNGTLINEENVERFKVFNDGITISLDGHIAEINDKTRGLGSYNKIIKGIKLLNKAGIEVRITTVISKTNKDYIKEIMEFVKNDLGVSKHNMSTHISMGRGAEENLECSTEEVLRYREEYFTEICRRSRQEMISFLRPNLKQGQLRNCCGAGCTELFVKDNGEVYPCRLLVDTSFYLGNIKENLLDSILESKKIVDLRNNFNVNRIAVCKHCLYKNLCGGGCRSTHSAYTGDLYTSDTNLCKILKSELDSAIMIDCGYEPITRRKL